MTKTPSHVAFDPSLDLFSWPSSLFGRFALASGTTLSLEDETGLARTGGNWHGLFLFEGELRGFLRVRTTAENDRSRKSLTCGYLSARATGLEPATTGSTVRYSNQLSYAPKSFPYTGLGCFRAFSVPLRNSWPEEAPPPRPWPQ